MVRTKRGRILVIEDDADTLQCYRIILVYGGFEVFEAEDGGVGLEIALRELPDLIVTDIDLPTLSGWEIAGLLKSDPQAQHIPLVAVSGGGRKNREQASTLGFSRYFEKPFSPSQLLKEVRDLLARGESQHGGASPPCQA